MVDGTGQIGQTGAVAPVESTPPPPPATEGAPPPATEGAPPPAESAPPPASEPASSGSNGAEGESAPAGYTLTANHEAPQAPQAPLPPAPEASPEAQTANYSQGYEISPEYADLLARAQSGDQAAVNQLQQMRVAQQVQQQTQALGEQLEHEQVAEKKGEEPQVYKDAKERLTYLDRTQRGLEDAAKKFKPESPVYKTLKQQAEELAEARRSLDARVRAFEARREDVKAADAQRQLSDLTRTGPRTPTAATPGRASQQGNPNPAVKIVSGKPVQGKVKAGGKPVKAPVPRGDGTRTATRGSGKKDQPGTADKSRDAKEVAKKDEKVPQPGREDVRAAEKAVAAHVPDEVRAKRLEQFKKRGEEVARKMRVALADARGRLNLSPDAVRGAGAEKLYGLKRAEHYYRKTHERGLEDLEGGRASLCGLVFCDRGVARLAGGEGQTARDRLHLKADAILDARPGDERYELARIVSPRPGSFVSDYEPGQEGNIFGYFRNWVPPAKREPVGADFHSDNIREERV